MFNKDIFVEVVIIFPCLLGHLVVISCTRCHRKWNNKVQRKEEKEKRIFQI